MKNKPDPIAEPRQLPVIKINPIDSSFALIPGYILDPVPLDVDVSTIIPKEALDGLSEIPCISNIETIIKLFIENYKCNKAFLSKRATLLKDYKRFGSTLLYTARNPEDKNATDGYVLEVTLFERRTGEFTLLINIYYIDALNENNPLGVIFNPKTTAETLGFNYRERLWFMFKTINNKTKVVSLEQMSKHSEKSIFYKISGIYEQIFFMFRPIDNETETTSLEQISKNNKKSIFYKISEIFKKIFLK